VPDCKKVTVPVTVENPSAMVAVHDEAGGPTAKDAGLQETAVLVVAATTVRPNVPDEPGRLFKSPLYDPSMVTGPVAVPPTEAVQEPPESVHVGGRLTVPGPADSDQTTVSPLVEPKVPDTTAVHVV